MGFRKKYRIFICLFILLHCHLALSIVPLYASLHAVKLINSSIEMSLLILLAAAALHGNFCCCFLAAVASSHAKRASASAESGEIQDRPWRKTEKRETDGEDQRLSFSFFFFLFFLHTPPTPPHPHGPSALNVKEQSAGETDSRRRCEWDD